MTEDKNNSYSLKKAKGIFIYDIRSNRFYDFKNNSNILGHSYKRLTTITKDHISSRWNLLGNTVIHRRFRKLIEGIFSKEYYLVAAFSLAEFMLRLINYSQEKNKKIKIIGNRFKMWLNEKCISLKSCESGEIIIHDMAEMYLNSSGNHDEVVKSSHNLEKNKITILNYYWSPYLETTTESADVIILPEIYSGNFNYLNILINKKSALFPDYKYIADQLEENIPALYLASSMKQYHLIKRINPGLTKLNWNDVVQSGRIFTFNKTEENYINKMVKKYYEKKILLNNKPPYYNYLPIQLEDFQMKYLSRIKL